jgi:hypothetical protein
VNGGEPFVIWRALIDVMVGLIFIFAAGFIWERFFCRRFEHRKL